MSVKIVVDSSSDIDWKEAEKLGVSMIPMLINFDEAEYMDGVDISRDEFYEKLVKCSNLPKTSMINAFRFEEEFRRHVENGDEVVAIVLSSKLSGTCEAAKEAASNFNEKVFVVDSLNASAGIKLLANYALMLVEEGKSAKEVYECLENKKQNVKIMAMVDTLKYLKKGGRVSSLLAFAGELMGIKPIAALVDGKVEVIGKAIGLKKAVNFINLEINRLGGIDFNMPFYAIYSGNDQTKIDNYVKDNLTNWNCEAESVAKNCIGATIGTHVGPGAIGIAFFAK